MQHPHHDGLVLRQHAVAQQASKERHYNVHHVGECQTVPLSQTHGHQVGIVPERGQELTVANHLVTQLLVRVSKLGLVEKIGNLTTLLGTAVTPGHDQALQVVPLHAGGPAGLGQPPTSTSKALIQLLQLLLLIADIQPLLSEALGQLAQLGLGLGGGHGGGGAAVANSELQPPIVTK